MIKEIIINNITYHIDNDIFLNVNIFNAARYFKGLFKNEERFKERYFNELKDYLIAYNRRDRLPNINLLLEYFREAKEFTFKEAFSIKNDDFRALVFGTINVPDMIKELGHERICTEGKELTLRKYKENGSFILETNTVIYELHKINGQKLNISDCFAIKCWCTTTNKEYWLWIDEKYSKKGSLEGIASTFYVYENMIPYIKSLKRQGDVLLFEMTEEVFPEGNIIPLTADQYFQFLISQS